ncbi:Amino acid permease [Fusarium falciforme]|uniref:Amino acid permease n=1 Tax=Fusarium falciforme TaxID=195108 RepID=UPI002301F226|nr:Amino acid permease [Fusarium falciforme]WAO94390.1 Amino acid permease [Fusarium falciforme]
MDNSSVKRPSRDAEKSGPEREFYRTETIQNGDQMPSVAEETHRGFKPRHTQMIALGGTIGTSLFLGTGQTLLVGGPAYFITAYIALSFVIYGVMTGMAEMATFHPVAGSTMSFYGNKYVSRSLGLAMGYLYWYTLGVLVPYELVASSILIDYWGSNISPAVWITVILVIIVSVNAMPVQYFGEFEFWAAGMKVILIVGLIILSIVLFFGGDPTHDALYFRFWKDPGAVNTYIVDDGVGYFISLLQSFVLASFAFVLAPEQLIVTAGEMQNPRRNLPRAARRYLWRFIILYIPAVLGISVICASDDPMLGKSGASSSPFVIAIKNAKIPVLDSIVNAMIVLSASTAGNAFLYSSSRNLYSLAVAGNAPAIFKRCNKHGLPYVAVAASASLSVLAYLSLSETSSSVFTWLISLTNTSGYLSWMCSGVIYIRYQKTIRYHGLQPPFRSRVQPWGMHAGTITSTLLLLLNGFTVFFPSKWSAASFLTSYIGIAAFLCIWLGHRFYHWSDPWFRRPEDIDMREGLDEALETEHPIPNRSKFLRAIHALYE